MVYNKNNQKDKTLINKLIRASKVCCIDNDGTNLGILNLSEALKIALDQNLDLVQINNNNPPTCKVIDYGKYKYDLSKKQKLAERKQRESEIKIKEIKFRPFTGVNDLKIKAKKALEFLDEGNKLKISIVFNGSREMSHKEVALDVLRQFMDFLPNCQFQGSPSMDGKCLVVFIEKVLKDIKKAM